MFLTTSALLNVPVPLTRVQIPPGITNYAAPIPLAAVQDSLLKNGLSPPGILTITAVAEGVAKSAVLNIVPVADFEPHLSGAQGYQALSLNCVFLPEPTTVLLLNIG
jgi:hypothetical protein